MTSPDTLSHTGSSLRTYARSSHPTAEESDGEGHDDLVVRRERTAASAVIAKITTKLHETEEQLQKSKQARNDVAALKVQLTQLEKKRTEYQNKLEEIDARLAAMLDDPNLPVSFSDEAPDLPVISPAMDALMDDRVAQEKALDTVTITHFLISKRCKQKGAYLEECQEELKLSSNNPCVTEQDFRVSLHRGGVADCWNRPAHSNRSAPALFTTEPLRPVESPVPEVPAVQQSAAAVRVTSGANLHSRESTYPPTYW